jgi:hypothetical protein
MARASRPLLGVLEATGLLQLSEDMLGDTRVLAAMLGDIRGGVSRGSEYLLTLLLLDDDWRRMAARDGRRICRFDALGLSFLWVSRCCFMLSERVNLRLHPDQLHGTVFSAVWILAWREAWPDVVKVL